jgi:sigma-B regulation protein RsbU (phosphoserine phosphatase)
MGVLIADASGHSIPAAMVAIMARLAFADVSRHSIRPGEVLAALNLRLQGLADERFVSAFYGVFDRAQRRLTFANAGHPPPLHYVSHSQACLPLDTRGLLLGIMPDVTYEEKCVELAPGDRLCLYTDGVTESRNPDGTQFGFGRLEQALTAAGRGGTDAVLQHLVESLTSFRSGRSADDDVTLVVAEVRS